MKNLFAERLKEARLRANMNMADLAKKTGLTASAISSYETTDEEKNKAPSLPNAMKLAEALGVSLEWLSGFDAVSTVDRSYEALAEIIFKAFEILLDHYFEISTSDPLDTNTHAAKVYSEAIQDYVEKIKSVREAIKVSGLDDEMGGFMLKKLRDRCTEKMVKELKRYCS